MVETDPVTLEALLHRGRWLTFLEFVGLIEQDHPHEGPGVPRELLDAYAAAIVDDLGPFAPFAVDQVDRLLDLHRTDSDVWLDSAVYEVEPDRISLYPPTWHERLRGETDPREYVVVMRDEIAAARGYTTRGRDAPGVPKEQLIDAMVTLGGVDRHAATGRIREMRVNGDLLLFPFQNPEADVQLPESAEPLFPGGPTERDPPRSPAGDDPGDESGSPPRSTLPPLVDVRDDLQYLDAHGPAGIGDDLDGIEEALLTLPGSAPAEQVDALDEVEDALFHLGSATDGPAGARVERARTRVRTYRRVLGTASEGLTVVEHSIRHAHSGHVAPLGALRNADAEVRCRVRNEGRSRDVVVVVEFYDRDCGTLSKARSGRTYVETEREQVVSVPVRVPPAARYYTATPLDAEDYLVQYQFQ